MRNIYCIDVYTLIRSWEHGLGLGGFLALYTM